MHLNQGNDPTRHDAPGRQDHSQVLENTVQEETKISLVGQWHHLLLTALWVTWNMYVQSSRLRG